MLDWAKSQKRNIHLKNQRLQCHALVEESIAPYDLVLKRKKITLKKRIPKELYMNADKQLMISVLGNILNNAIKYSFEGGEIRIRIFETENQIGIEVVDNGLGMTNEQLNAVQNTDVQDPQQGTMNELGTGLGLQICREFVKLLQGELLINSAFNKGTTVKVQFLK